MQHQNGFHRERHAWPHFLFPCGRCLVVVDEGRHVEVVSYAMASKLLVYMVTVRVCVFLDCIADLGELNAWLALLYADEHCFPRYFR